MNSALNRVLLPFCGAAGLSTSSGVFGQAPPVPSPDLNSQGVRFAVAHEHTIGWCLGYLYVTPDSVKYAEASPAKFANHSFEFKRSEVTHVGQWMRSQQPLNAVEINVGRNTYHFWVMPNEQAVQTGRNYQWNPPDAVDPHQLIAMIQGVGNIGNASPVQSLGTFA